MMKLYFQVEEYLQIRALARESQGKVMVSVSHVVIARAEQSGRLVWLRGPLPGADTAVLWAPDTAGRVGSP